MSKLMTDSMKIIPIELVANIASTFNYSVDQLLFDRLDNPYKQYAEFERLNHGLKLSDTQEDGPEYGEEQDYFELVKLLIKESGKKREEEFKTIISYFERILGQTQEMHGAIMNEDIFRILQEGMSKVNDQKKSTS